MNRLNLGSLAGLGLLALCLFAGCASSPPMRFYTLNDIAPQTRLTAPAQAAPIRLTHIGVPAELDRMQLVRRLDANRLQIEELDRWAAPLDQLILRALTDDLSGRLPENMVVSRTEHGVKAPVRALNIEIDEFFADSSCAVTLRATWALNTPDAGSAPGSGEVHVPGSGACAASAVPAAMSAALARLSDAVAAAVVR